MFHNVSKIYEKCLYSQLYNYFDKNIFWKYQSGYCKGFSTQHALLLMIEKMKTAHDNNEFCEAILTDLSKTSDFIWHDCLIDELNAYGFYWNVLNEAYLWLH